MTKARDPKEVELVAKAFYLHFFGPETGWPPTSAPDLGMEAENWRRAAKRALGRLDRYRATKTAGRR